MTRHDVSDVMTHNVGVSTVLNREGIEKEASRTSTPYWFSLYEVPGLVGAFLVAVGSG